MPKRKTSTAKATKPHASFSSRVQALMARIDVHEIARRTQVSVPTLYRWRANEPKRITPALLAAFEKLEAKTGGT